MDFLEQPEIKKTYEKCKYVVKVWEHKFTKKNNRVPSKLDIKEAPTEVRYAYRKYFQLKTKALEQSFMDVDGFDDDDDNENLTDVDSQTNGIEKTADEKELVGISHNELLINGDQVTEKFSVKIEEKVDSSVVSSETWGTHLNYKKESENKEPQKKTNLNSMFSKKLFCGSKFNKRNPRKSKSFSQKNKSETNMDTPQFLSQQEPTVSSFSFNSEEFFAMSQEDNVFCSDQFKIITATEKVISQPVSLLQDSYSKTVRVVDKGWVDRVAQNTGIFTENIVKKNNEITKVDYDSEDIIDESDDETLPSQKLLASPVHVAKRRKTGSYEASQPNTSSNVNTESKVLTENCNSVNVDLAPTISVETKTLYKENNELNRANNTNKQNKNEIGTKTLNELNSINDSTSDKNEVNTLLNNEKDDPDENKSKRTKPKCTVTPKQRKIKKVLKKNNCSAETGTNTNLRRSSRVNKVKASFQELSSSEEDPFHSDNDSNDPEFTLEETEKHLRLHTRESATEYFTNEVEESGRKPKEKAAKSKNNKTKLKENVYEEPKQQYELEFSVKSRIVTPRYSSIKNVIKEKAISVKSTAVKSINKEEIVLTGPKDKMQQQKEKFEKKIASGSLSENFITINLKKKIFARGKSGRSFGKWKKAQWKTKKKSLYGPDMDMGGCDGGMLTCFNCGQIGHFARHCQNTKGDGLLPLSATQQMEDDCPYPTLEEASQMASNSALSIRKPQKTFSTGTTTDTIQMYNENSDSDENNRTGNADNYENNCEFDDFDSELLLQEAVKLEEHVKKLDVRSYVDTTRYVEPYYQLKEDNTIIDATPEIYEALTMFGHSCFRPGQEKAIMRILSGKSTIVTLSTGSGKSLCYQLPAYLYSKRETCITLVISPLVSLMEDQVTGIPKFLKAACLHTNQTKTQREKIMEALSLGELNVLLISPEAVVAGEKQTGFGSILRKLPPIAFACIDEAHCVSQWSHNFRPSYLMICRVLKESLGIKTILGLTATATRFTEDSIIKHIGVPDGREGIITDVPLPNNLILTVSKDRNRDMALLELLLSEKYAECKSIIVYCTRRDECEKIAKFLRTSLKDEKPLEVTSKKRKRAVNLQAEPYHAGLSASRRKAIQNRFMSGELRIVVATVAFGMGINKSDIRSVIHFNMPRSFESYVQEVGRAGRDGLKAYCHLFLDPEGRDESELRRHIHANSIDRHVIRKLLQKVFIPCSCKDVCPKHEVAFSIEETVQALDIPEENISTLLCYLELHKNRYIELLSPAYTQCKIVSYGGPLQIRKMAKDCPPLAMALALHQSKSGKDTNILEFPVIDIAAAMGWESGICKHKLKNLEWTTVNNLPKRSTLSVQFFKLGFRMLAPGNLKEEELDEALDSLYSHVVEQERQALKQLHVVHKTLVQVAKSSYKQCLSEENGSSVIKQKIREYFNSADPLSDIEEVKAAKTDVDRVVNDVQAIISTYRDNQFTGRAIARIMHGIPSPNYPAVIWGRCKFWRSHLLGDFHEICRIATQEILRLR